MVCGSEPACGSTVSSNSLLGGTWINGEASILATTEGMSAGLGGLMTSVCRKCQGERKASEWPARWRDSKVETDWAKGNGVPSMGKSRCSATGIRSVGDDTRMMFAALRR